MLAHALARPGTILLDSARADADTGDAGALLFADPSETVVANTLDEVGPCLDALDAHLARGAHVAGLIAYEAGAALVSGLTPAEARTDVPLVWFGVYDAPQRLGADDLAAVFERLGADADITNLTFALGRETYRERIASVKARIRAGDVYQVNLTAPLRFETRASALGLYAALRARQAVPYGALLNLPGAAVLSVSPELFVRIDGGEEGRTITARPMKGTAPRGATVREDDRLARALVGREKDRAENLMIVDLLRNDLSRVSEPGSVAVPHLFEAERYETLTQMTSTVTATLRPDATLGDVLRATFPCGSVTGAPKRRAIEVLRTLEDGPRGAYCGAVGYAAPGEGGMREAAFNVCIRTATLTPDGRGTYAVGSGVVWDSEADAEYDECLLKARVLSDLADAPVRIAE